MTAFTIRSQLPRFMVPLVLCLVSFFFQFHLHNFRILRLWVQSMCRFFSCRSTSNTLVASSGILVLDFKLKIIHTSLFNQSVQWSIDPQPSDALCVQLQCLWMKALSMNSCLAQWCALRYHGHELWPTDRFHCSRILIRVYFGNIESYRLPYSIRIFRARPWSVSGAIKWCLYYTWKFSNTAAHQRIQGISFWIHTELQVFRVWGLHETAFNIRILKWRPRVFHRENKEGESS